MEETSAHTGRPALGESLQSVLNSEDVEGPSIGEITATVGEKGFGLLLMVLSLPSALPVPAPGYSTPFGIVIGFIAVQLMIGRTQIWLPAKFSKVRIKPELARKMIGAAKAFLDRIERLIRPRQKWMSSRGGQIALASVVLLMSSLMILPIPLTNTFPAMVIFFVGISLSEDDGLIALGALAIGFAALCLYAGIIYLLISQGPEAIDGLKETIKGLLGLS